MPGKARNKIVDPDKVGVYRCYSRCVRRAFLCGDDPYTGKNYDHRNKWVRDKTIELAAIFAVQVGWYAVLDNHLHLVLRNRPDLARRRSDRQVIQRACRLFPYAFGQKGVQNGQPTPKQLRELARDKQLVKKMRERLSSLSWFMKRLCEPTAKRANRVAGSPGGFPRTRPHDATLAVSRRFRALRPRGEPVRTFLRSRTLRAPPEDDADLSRCLHLPHLVLAPSSPTERRRNRPEGQQKVRIKGECLLSSFLLPSTAAFVAELPDAGCCIPRGPNGGIAPGRITSDSSRRLMRNVR